MQCQKKENHGNMYTRTFKAHETSWKMRNYLEVMNCTTHKATMGRVTKVADVNKPHQNTNSSNHLCVDRHKKAYDAAFSNNFFLIIVILTLKVQ